MPDLARSLGKFLYRDVFYIVAGFIIFSSVIQVFRPDIFADTDGDVLGTALAVAFAYAVGILNQEIWSQLPVVKTCLYEQYPGFLLRIYRRHTGEEWVYRASNSKALADDPDYQRAINLKQIGSALGTSLYTGAAFVLVASYMRSSPPLALQAIAMLVLGSLFVLMSWLHNMRQAAFRSKTRDSS